MVDYLRDDQWTGCARRVEFALGNDSESLADCSARLEQWSMIRYAVIAEDNRGIKGYVEFSGAPKRATIDRKLGTNCVYRPNKPAATIITETKSKGDFVVFGEAAKQGKRNDLVREAEPAKRRHIIFSDSEES